jgi:hypothetical protein
MYERRIFAVFDTNTVRVEFAVKLTDNFVNRLHPFSKLDVRRGFPLHRPMASVLIREMPPEERPRERPDRMKAAPVATRASCSIAASDIAASSRMCE